MRRRLLELIVCPLCHGQLTLKEDRVEADGLEQVAEGTLRCGACGVEYPVVDSVPWLAPVLLSRPDDAVRAGKLRTASFYGYGWRRPTSNKTVARDARTHFDMMARIVPCGLLNGPLVLDGGCGGGRDLAAMAERHPDIEFVGVDLSEGVYMARWRARGLPNVHVVRADLGGLPFRDGTFSSVYSYGVLHHTPDPAASLIELTRVAKPAAPVVTYLYEDFSENRVYFWLARIENG